MFHIRLLLSLPVLRVGVRGCCPRAATSGWASTVCPQGQPVEPGFGSTREVPTGQSWSSVRLSHVWGGRSQPRACLAVPASLGAAPCHHQQLDGLVSRLGRRVWSGDSGMNCPFFPIQALSSVQEWPRERWLSRSAVVGRAELTSHLMDFCVSCSGDVMGKGTLLTGVQLLL